MEDYSFHVGPIERLHDLSFEISLFNHPQNLSLQSDDGWITFFVYRKSRHNIQAIIHFHFDGAVAKSLLNNPFGSYEFYQHIPPAVLYKFIDFVEIELSKLGVKVIYIKNPPVLSSNKNLSMLTSFLVSKGYAVGEAHLSAMLKIGKDVRKVFHRVENRKLMKANLSGLVFSQLPLSQLSEAYKLIYDVRAAKGYKLSMSLSALQKAINQFPDNYFLFGVYDQQKLVAASVAIKVNSRVLYDFYHDHDPTYNDISPVVLLIKGMYTFCLDNNFKYLDLGTSSLEQGPNFGLLDFKIHLGAKLSTKFVFQKDL